MTYPDYVVLKVEKGVYGSENKITIYNAFESEKSLDEYFNYHLDIPTSGEEYHKAFLIHTSGIYYAPLIKQEYRLTNREKKNED